MPEHYSGHDIFISKDGTWHYDGFERSPERALKHIDVVFNGLHGEYGQDGKVQKLLDMLGMRYTGSGALASAISMNKALSKIAFEKNGIKTPYSMTVHSADPLKDKIQQAFKSFSLPIIVQPATGSASGGMSIVQNINHLLPAIEKAFSYSPTVLLEEYIQGKPASCAIADHFRGQKTYSFLPIETYPDRFSTDEKTDIQRLAQLVHQSLGLRHYSQTDMIVSPTHGVYVIKVNTLPEMTLNHIFHNHLKPLVQVLRKWSATLSNLLLIANNLYYIENV
jgi:D-alanine-D-alanine ligase